MNTTNIMTMSLSAQCYDGIRHIALKAGSDMMTMFGLYNLKTSYINQ